MTGNIDIFQNEEIIRRNDFYFRFLVVTSTLSLEQNQMNWKKSTWKVKTKTINHLSMKKYFRTLKNQFSLEIWDINKIYFSFILSLLKSVARCWRDFVLFSGIHFVVLSTFECLVFECLIEFRVPFLELILHLAFKLGILVQCSLDGQININRIIQITDHFMRKLCQFHFDSIDFLWLPKNWALKAFSNHYFLSFAVSDASLFQFFIEFPLNDLKMTTIKRFLIQKLDLFIEMWNYDKSMFNVLRHNSFFCLFLR